MWEEIEQKGEVGGRKVRYEYRKANKLKSLCIHESELGFVKEHLGLNIKDKTDGWLTVNEAMKELRTSIQNSDFTSFWKEIQETGEFQGRKVRAETRRNHSFTTFYIHESELDYVREVLNFSIPEKTKEWKAKYEFQKLLKVSKSNTEFFALWKELEETGKIAEVKFECGNMQSGKKRPFCINVSETEKFEKALGIDKKKTEEWKSKSDVYKILGVSVTSKLFSELWKQLEETSEIDGKKVRSGYRRAYNKSPFCVHESKLDLLREKLLLNLPEKTEEWKISVDFAKLIQTNAGGEVFQALWKEVVRCKIPFFPPLKTPISQLLKYRLESGLIRISSLGLPSS